MRRIHHVSCSAASDDYNTADFERVALLAEKIEKYARKLGFGVMSENVDNADDDMRGGVWS